MDKVLFGLVLILIFLVIVVNINQVEATSAEELKKLPFDKRSLYIKMTELYDKLYKKNNLTIDDIKDVEELIEISSILKESKKHEFAENLKFLILTNELERLNLTPTQRLGLYILKHKNISKEELQKLIEGE
ncbi:hypothetical protein [Thermosipho globiformans]|uniref:hypothetical protein n=1 Tax=Thermosipho globiformans TaxID=380685 RepID=UPI000F8DC2D9|nr:hypothetical protein [Thermosipho globiformans]